MRRRSNVRLSLALPPRNVRGLPPAPQRRPARRKNLQQLVGSYCSQGEAAPTPWLYRSVGDSPTHRTRLVSRTMRNEPFAHLSLLTVPAEVPGELALPPLISQLPGGGHATHPSGKVVVASWHSPGRPEVLHGPFAKKTFVLQETDIARRHDGGRFSLLAL